MEGKPPRLTYLVASLLTLKKELGINFETYSPEMVLQVAKIIDLKEDQVAYRIFVRPGAAEEEEAEERLSSFAEVVTNSWKRCK